MEKKGYLTSERILVNLKSRRDYFITPLGRKELETGKQRVRELFGELFEDEAQK